MNAIFSRPDASQEERDFMMQFSVFTGSVPKQVVEEIIAPDIMYVAPKSLKKKNLISFSNGYYETHSLVRAFCYNKLNDKEGLHKKVAEYYIEQRTNELNPALEERIFYHLALSKQWERVEKEIEEKGRQFILQGQHGLVKEFIEKLKELKIEKPIFNIFYGDIAEIQGNWDKAMEFYEHAKNQKEDRKIKAEGMIKYAEILYRKGNVKEALPFYEEAYEFTKNTGSLKKEEARAINDIGLVYHFIGETDKALIKYNEALNIRLRIIDNEGLAASFCNIGTIYDTKGDLEKALKYHEKSLKLEEEIGNKNGVAASISIIGKIYKTQGDLAKALEYYEKSLKIEEEIGHKEGIASSFTLIGDIYYTKRDLVKALEYFEKSFKINEEIGHKEGIAISLSNIGGIFKANGDLAKSLDYRKKSLYILEEIGNKEGIAASLDNIGGIYKAKGDLAKSLDYRQKSLEIFEEIDNKKGIGTTLNNLGAVYADKSKTQYDLALDCFLKSLSISNSMGAKTDATITTKWLIDLRDEIGFGKFKSLAQQAYAKLDDELQKHVPIKEILNEPIRAEKKTERNDPCPCGSRKKYKNCHGQ